LLSKSNKLLTIFARAYPTIIVDEFQDTNSDEWDVIKLLGKYSTIVALADADQRIYEFRGADPARIGQYIKEFSPETYDFTNENNRSSGTDINNFGNDLLTGANKEKQYNDVSVSLAPFYQNRHEMFSLKASVLNAIKRISNVKDWSIAILVPTKHQMLAASNYLSSQKDNLPSLEHDVAIDAEGPTLAGELFAKLLEDFPTKDEIFKSILRHQIKYLRGRKGADPPTQVDLKLSEALQKYLETGKIRGSRRESLINEIDRIAEERLNSTMTGNPFADWMDNIKIFHELATEPPLVGLREDARYVRLLHKGSYLREKLNSAWKDHGCYLNANQIFLDTVQRENFSSTIKKMSGINVMTIHKSKGKQFTEVFLYEGYRRGRFVRNPSDPKSIEQAKLTLRVGVTRARQRTTIITPRNNVCELI
jgi:DNA helicase-2/ATP-dependent DNA helicase PcrA